MDNYYISFEQSCCSNNYTHSKPSEFIHNRYYRSVISFDFKVIQSYYMNISLLVSNYTLLTKHVVIKLIKCYSYIHTLNELQHSNKLIIFFSHEHVLPEFHAKY